MPCASRVNLSNSALLARIVPPLSNAVMAVTDSLPPRDVIASDKSFCFQPIKALAAVHCLLDITNKPQFFSSYVLTDHSRILKFNSS